jgi:DNA mismatch repair protein MSH2
LPRQEFFSAHAQDALLIANTVYKTNNVIKYLGAGASSKSQSSSRADGKGLPSVTMSMTLAKGFLREALTTKQLRVEIWETESGKKGNRWVLGKEASLCDQQKTLSKADFFFPFMLPLQASPGNLQQVEDLLFSNTDNLSSPIVMAIKLSMVDGNRNIGIAFADASARMLGMSEFPDDEMFSNTEVSDRRLTTTTSG